LCENEPSLRGCLAKIARANEQLQALKTQIAATSVDTDSITFAEQFDPDTSTVEVTLENVPELPIELGLAAADPLQNLRAAINYLAWELAKWNLAQEGKSRKPDRNTQWPINTTPREFSDHMVTDIDPRHVAIIKMLQPNGPAWLRQFPEDVLQQTDPKALAKSHPLAALADLTNVDKHQALQPALVSPRELNLGNYEPVDCVIKDSRSTLNLTLKNGAHWVTCDIEVTGPNPKVNVKDHVSAPEIEFEGGDLKRFQWIADSVRAIVRDFEPLF
jgi:hypothetical protein